MTWKQLKQNSQPHFYAIFIDRFFPKTLRGVIRKISVFAAIFFFLASFGTLPLDFSYADGIFFLCVFVFISLVLLEGFYRSMKNEGLHSILPERILEEGPTIEYGLSKIIYKTDEIDVSRGFCDSAVGREILFRSGISPSDLKSFLNTDKTPIIASSLVLVSEHVTLADYAASLYEADKSLQAFLSSNSVNKNEFVGAATWGSEMEERRRKRERFWSKANLGSIPSIGTSWGYGISSDLGRFGKNFEYNVNLGSIDTENGYRDREVSLLEGILERREEANAIIIDDDESVARDIVARLLKKIKLGITLPSIEHKNIMELDWGALSAAFKNRGELEAETLKILNQAASAGNIILYMRDLPAFAANMKTLGINLPSLIAPHLASRDLQVIAHAGNADFHYFIETNPSLLERFERVIPDEAGAEASLPAIKERALDLEEEYGITFSFPSLLALANAAERYVTLGEMPGKALDLMTEIAPFAVQKEIFILKEADVLSFVSGKTGVSAGPMKENEAERIAQLEEVLHKRVIGQNAAVSAIASAMRRARSGIASPNRPLGSFLFLGPTGVGKTETSKALSESFFGDENKMIRFDMSEYNGPDALSRLIGSFGENKTGLLASRLRDNPYGVLLLDEFEKAARDVLDLFLQILDEGIFTDALGKKVNCRNLIIIATSNAGSQIIWDTLRAGKDLVAEKDHIIDVLIREKIFRPELINRFDGVILFHPLENSELKTIARLELEKFSKRLKEQEIEFVINDDLVNFLVEKGSDPQFGARSLNRAIKDIVEDLVARKIVSGEAGPGSKIELNVSELK